MLGFLIFGAENNPNQENYGILCIIWIHMYHLEIFFSIIFTKIQACRRNTVGSIPDHYNTVNTAIKQVT